MLGQLDIHEEKLYIVPPPHPQSYIFPKNLIYSYLKINSI